MNSPEMIPKSHFFLKNKKSLSMKIFPSTHLVILSLQEDWHRIVLSNGDFAACLCLVGRIII